MASKLFEAVHVSHEKREEKVRSLLETTKGFEEDMRELLANDATIKLVTEEEEKEVQKTFKQKTTICVFGERNCGKSSMLNELLGTKIVPVSDTPCTSRVTHIRYSKQPYYCLFNEDGTEITGSRKQLKSNSVVKEVKTVAATNNNDERDDARHANITVEIGLDHPSLKHGVEIIDSPGRNENNVLDEIVDKLVKETKKAMLIYVIDGKNGLRPADRDTIQLLKDAGGRDKLFYVCSKVDTDKQAEEMDTGSDEESESEDESPRQDPGPSKATTVLNELKRHGLLEESNKFYGLSFKKVRQARIKKYVSKSDESFLEDFEKFKTDLGHRLDVDLKMSSLRAVSAFLKCHARGFLCFFRKQQELEEREEELNRILKSARQSEKSLFNELTTLVGERRDEIQGIVTDSIESVTETLKWSAQDIKIERVRAHDIYLESHLSKKGLVQDDEFCSYHTLCREIRNCIVNKVYYRVLTDVESLLEDDVAPVMWPKIISTIEALDNPMLRRSIETIYHFIGHQSDYREGTRSSLTKLLFSLVAAVKISLNQELLKVYDADMIMNFAVESYDTQAGCGDAPEVIVDKLTSYMDGVKLASCILQACNERMQFNHTSFTQSMKQIEFLNREVQINVNEEVGATIHKNIAKLAMLEIQNHALKFELRRGILEMGNKLAEGQHCAIYECKPGWRLTNPELCAIRVIKRQDECVWRKAITALYYAFNCKDSKHLLGIHGWMFTDDDSLSVVVDRAETNLENAVLSQKGKLEVVLGVVKGINAIHSSGFIYNNLDARNVLITEDGTVKINVCKGKYEILHAQASDLDIHQIGQLLLWLHGGERSKRKHSSSTRWSRPPSCSNDKVWRLTEACLSAHGDISLHGIIRDLEATLRQSKV